MRTCGRVGVKIYKTTPEFWASYRNLPREIQQLADKSFELLKRDPRHPALHFKKVGNRWSARISKDYRALAREEDGLLVWIWIGKHDEYMRRIRSVF